MKSFYAFNLLALLLVTGTSYGQMPSSKMGSGKIEERKHMEPLKPGAAAPTPPTRLPEAPKPSPQIAQRAEYLHPGILVYLNGKWEGSDHLLNLPNNIGVYVTVVKPEDEQINISQQQLQKEVEIIFGKANINPTTLALSGKPPLPAFEIEVFLYPIDKGYAACVDGRLFESVILERFKMDPNMAFQAITWEKQSLIVGPKATFNEQLIQTVQSIATAFVERFIAYERIKSEVR